MSDELGFRIVAFSLFIATMGISIYFRHQAERQGNPLRSSAGRGFIVLMRLLGLGLLLPFFAYLVNPAWVAWAKVALPDWVRWIAVGVAVATLPVTYSVFSHIGNNISPAHTTRQQHKLIKAGPYRWVRHPLYTTASIFFAAMAVITSLWWLGAGIVVVFFFVALRVPKEEAQLIATFGDEYRDYMKQAGRFLPRLRAG